MDETLNLEINNEDVMEGKYLTFIIKDGEYGVEISYILEIISVQDITPVPHTHQYVKGIINLRGTIIPVIDLRLRFSLDEIEYDDRTCIIVINIDNISIGMVVDEVQEVVNIDDDSVHSPPNAGSTNGIDNKFIKAIGMAGGTVKQLLDLSKVFDVEDLLIGTLE